MTAVVKRLLLMKRIIREFIYKYVTKLKRSGFFILIGEVMDKYIPEIVAHYENMQKKHTEQLSHYYQGIIEKEAQEILRLQAQIEAQGFSRGDVEALRQELRGLRERNLKEATFEERVDLVAMLGIKVYPAEDLKSRRIVCRLNLKKVVGEREQNDFAKVIFGGPPCTIGRTFKLAFSLTI